MCLLGRMPIIPVATPRARPPRGSTLAPPLVGVVTAAQVISRMLYLSVDLIKCLVISYVFFRSADLAKCLVISYVFFWSADLAKCLFIDRKLFFAYDLPKGHNEAECSVHRPDSLPASMLSSPPGVASICSSGSSAFEVVRLDGIGPTPQCSMAVMALATGNRRLSLLASVPGRSGCARERRSALNWRYVTRQRHEGPERVSGRPYRRSVSLDTVVDGKSWVVRNAVEMSHNVALIKPSISSVAERVDNERHIHERSYQRGKWDEVSRFQPRSCVDRTVERNLGTGETMKSRERMDKSWPCGNLIDYGLVEDPSINPSRPGSGMEHGKSASRDIHGPSKGRNFQYPGWKRMKRDSDGKREKVGLQS